MTSCHKCTKDFAFFTANIKYFLICLFLSTFIDFYRLTDDVEDESADGADEGEDDEEPAGGRVPADQIFRPVLHVRVQGGLGQDGHLCLGPDRRLPLFLLRRRAANFEEKSGNDDEDDGEEEHRE